MGEAKRRKKLDSNFGKAKRYIFRWTELEVQRKMKCTNREWANLVPYIRVVDSQKDVDESVKGLWFYLSPDGELLFSLTSNEMVTYFARKAKCENRMYHSEAMAERASNISSESLPVRD